MRFSMMTEREKRVMAFANHILWTAGYIEEQFSDEKYMQYCLKLESLDEIDMCSLDKLLEITDSNDYTVEQVTLLTYFLDHPESRLKNFVRYER